MKFMVLNAHISLVFRFLRELFENTKLDENLSSEFLNKCINSINRVRALLKTENYRVSSIIFMKYLNMRVSTKQTAVG